MSKRLFEGQRESDLGVEADGFAVVTGVEFAEDGAVDVVARGFGNGLEERLEGDSDVLKVKPEVFRRARPVPGEFLRHVGDSAGEARCS